MSACPSVHLSVSLDACVCAGFYVQQSVLLSILLYASLDVFFQRVNVSACGQGYLSVLLFDRRSAHPYQCKYTVLFMFLSVCQPDLILSVCVRPSVKCKSACMRI